MAPLLLTSHVVPSNLADKGFFYPDFGTLSFECTLLQAKQISEKKKRATESLHILSAWKGTRLRPVQVYCFHKFS